MSMVVGVPTASPVRPTRGRWRPLGIGEVRITGGFWARRQSVNADASLPHIGHWLEREGWLGNFDLIAAGDPVDARRGREFSDSEVYKYLEAMAWEIGRGGDPSLERTFRRVVGRIARAQDADGYLNTAFGHRGQPPRWSDLQQGHELYCAGHLLQAAVARARTRPDADDGLVGLARRVAANICDTFGPGGLDGVCGHPEIETALVEFARTTGDDRYLAQAAIFLDRRGHGRLGDVEWGREYFQDDTPVREATVLRGHAVRANYLACGAADVAVERDDPGLLKAVRHQWRAAVARRTHLTGGQGSRHQDEAFGADWALPPDRAYAETCAAVGSVMLAWRLLLASGDPGCADLIERTLFNVVAASPAADGRSFFYTNPLHRREPGAAPDTDRPSIRAEAAQRAPWFEVSCCPTNVARILASLASYVATTDDEGLQIHQYAPATVVHRPPDSGERRVTVTTDYPDDGRIRVRIDSDDERPWTLSLRVPDWAGRGATLTVHGRTRPVDPGYVIERRRWRGGDEIVLSLPVEPRFTYPDPRIDAVRGCVAVERGPLVCAVESVDLPAGTNVEDLHVDPTRPPRHAAGRVLVCCRQLDRVEHDWPYGGPPGRPVEAGPAPVEVPLVAYHTWASRGPSTMRVWLPVA
ncbi:glycoside hydrolase family 127 protein [Micromonospora sp. DT227]|uniref:glycoside hydrolase family 127 protein n=1 Tax=Micromonospora sp. DT227 TaxID=3393433 RepID=UPI003CF0AFC8